MTRDELVKGTATFAAIAIAGWLSTTYVDRYFALADPTKDVATANEAACVDAEGSWKNWPWPNVPALSPKCGQDR